MGANCFENPQIDSCNLRTLKTSRVTDHKTQMGHFRVAVCLGFEVSLGARLLREMSLICITIRNSFPFEWLCTRTRFETKACSNSEMGYCTSKFIRFFYFINTNEIPSKLLC